MKVMHVEAGRYLYGGARQVQYLIEGLENQGIHNELVCTPDAEIGFAIEQSSPHCVVSRTPIGGDLDLPCIGRLRKLIKSRKPDLVHLHSRRGADWLGGIAAQLTGTPCVLSRRVDNPEKPWITRLKYRMYDSVVAISQGIGDVLISQGLSPAKLNVIPSAVDINAYKKTYERDVLYREFGVEKDVFCMGVIAQLIERKGHTVLLDALPALLKKNNSLQLIFFGQGPLMQSLKERVQASSLAPHVTFAGFRSDLHQYIGALDLVVHPAYMEGLGVSLLQAAAAGVPLVGCNAGGIPEIILDGKTGLLVPPGDSKKLEQAIAYMLDQPDFRQQCKEAARIHVNTHFSIDSMVNGNLANYRQVLANQQ